MGKDTVIQFEGTVYENGYGQVAQKVMRDKSLSTVAKAIYSYLCSFAGGNPLDERYAFPGVKLMMAELNIRSEDTYYKHRKQLVDKGYIKIKQEQGEAGKFDRNVYSIVAVPVEVDSTEKKAEKKPNPKKSGTAPHPKISSTENPSTDNQGIIISSFKYNQFEIKKDDDDKESIISLSFQKIAKEKELPEERYQEVLQRILQNKDGIVNVADYITSAVENELVKIKTKHRNTPGRTESRQHSPKQVEAIPELIKQQLERQKAVEKPKEGRSKEDIRKNVEAMLKEEAEFEKKQKRFEQLKSMMGENK